jgi:hypothetical protein
MRTRPSIPFLLDLLRMAMRKQASAIYIVPWMPPTLRIDENSVPLSSVSFTPEQSTLLVLDMLDDVHRAALDRSREVQFSFVLDGVGRFRVHAFRRHGQPAMAIRPFAIDVPTPRTLALPTLACTPSWPTAACWCWPAARTPLRRDAAAALLEHRNRHGHGDLAVLDDATRFWHERVRCQVRQGLNSARAWTNCCSGARCGCRPGWPPGPHGRRLGRTARRAAAGTRGAHRRPRAVPGDAGRRHLMTALHRLIRLADEAPATPAPPHGDRAARRAGAAPGAGPRWAARTWPPPSLMTSPDLAANLAEGDLDALRG